MIDQVRDLGVYRNPILQLPKVDHEAVRRERATGAVLTWARETVRTAMASLASEHRRAVQNLEQALTDLDTAEHRRSVEDKLLGP